MSPEDKTRNIDRLQARQRIQRMILPSDDDAWMRGSLPYVWEFVNTCLKQDPQPRKRLVDSKSFVKRKGEKQFCQLLRKMAVTDSWEELLENDLFFENVVIYEDVPLHALRTVERAWKADFKGNVADVLLTTISNHLNGLRKGYERHTSIVNSSGTGKSRMVDQLAKEVIIVPICLREDGSKGFNPSFYHAHNLLGFPPPDCGLRDWLTATTNQSLAEKKLYAFIYGLLTVLHGHLSMIDKCTPQPTEKGVGGAVERQEMLAFAFRRRMSEGQSLEGSGAYRTSFYDEVINEADKFLQASDGHAPNLKSPRQYPPEIPAVQGAGNAFCDFIDKGHLLDSEQGSWRPLLVLSFDESHILTDIPKDQNWSIYSKLCRTLQALVELPIFAVFLSTAGRFHLLSPERRADLSNRSVSGELKPLDPITEINFDSLAFPIGERGVTLGRVVEMDWIAHLGRPLFGSYCDTLVDKAELLHFAKCKLLNGPSTLNADNAPGILACLSVRFDLEFNSDEISRHVACTQVERHLRLCAATTSRFEHLVTLTGSEPLLAEAAHELMCPNANPVTYLATHSDPNCIDRGRHGELVAALIVMQTRDAVSSKSRWMYVPRFMQALLPVPAYENLCNSMPVSWREREYHSFSETFMYHSVWFNHVIKIEDPCMINTENLWRFITRGAMIVCTRCQYGVDIVLPVVCDMTEPLSLDNVTPKTMLPPMQSAATFLFLSK